jgi:hypothetical protein
VLELDEKYGGHRGQFFVSACRSLTDNIISKLITIANTLHADRDEMYGQVYIYCWLKLRDGKGR